MQASKSVPILEVENLAIAYETRHGDVPAVRDVSFKIHRGETFGIVGESGCGKSTVAFGIVNFLGRNGKIVGGRILFQGQDLVSRSQEELRNLRGDRIAMVYQDPMQALNPSMRLGDQMAEVLIVHRGLDKKAALQRCVQMLDRVHMPDPESVLRRYPHQISGGQQQRIVIAMALLNDPALLIMDEPTTALDVTVEAAVLDLINELQDEFDTAIMYITHNLGVIARVSDHIGVMYAGEMVERASVNDIFLKPSHPYTLGLMRCVPNLESTKTNSTLHPIRGRVPSPKALPPGCIFEPRCDFAHPACLAQKVEMHDVQPGHAARCLFTEEVSAQKGAFTDEQAHILAGLADSKTSEKPILTIEDAKTYYPVQSTRLIGGEKRFVKAVDGVSLSVTPGKTLGIVGESGCGKSTLVKTVIGLEKLTGGEIEFMNIDISTPVSKRSLDLIKDLQMVFQNPDSTLNPSYSVGYQIGRPLRRFADAKHTRNGTTSPDSNSVFQPLRFIGRLGTLLTDLVKLPITFYRLLNVPSDIRDEVVRLLDMMKLGESYYNRLPRQLSGGEKQRVAIARAIAAQPNLVLCDEPVSALDVSVQAAVLNLLLEIQQELGTTMVFIAHDLSVVRFFCDTIAVMYLGQIAEIGPAQAIYLPPYHPYTEALLSAVPIPDPQAEQKRIRLSGTVPSALNPPSGCRFHTRCPRRHRLPDGGKICETEAPPARMNTDDHRIYCHIPLEDLKTFEAVVTVEKEETHAG